MSTVQSTTLITPPPPPPLVVRGKLRPCMHPGCHDVSVAWVYMEVGWRSFCPKCIKIPVEDRAKTVPWPAPPRQNNRMHEWAAALDALNAAGYLFCPDQFWPIIYAAGQLGPSKGVQ